MKEFVTPWKTSSKETASDATSERNTVHSIHDTSRCPECNEKMAIYSANGKPAYTCLKHRIALPVPEVEVKQ